MDPTKNKSIALGFDTKVNKRVTLHSVITNFMQIKQSNSEANDAYLTRFKSMVETLNISGENTS